jgi:AcrR family transcriptional regulator
MEVPAESRRERHRRELIDDIIDSALDQLATGGPSAVSLRAIARQVGLSPASMYTYFASADEIFTELIIRSFGELSRALIAATDAAAAVTESPLDQLHRVSLQYRQWALANTARFNLVFTDQIHGYEAPPDGPTVAAEISVLQPMYRSIGPALGYELRYPELPAPAQRDIVGVFALIHGAVSLEANHHLGRDIDWSTLLLTQIDVSVARSHDGTALRSPAPQG